jgi:hypothetical protein
MIRKVNIFCILSFCLLTRLSGQSFFVPSDTLNKPRVYAALGVTTTVGTSIALGLYHTWYSKFEKSSFHFFNDWGEWRHMDKVGHIHTAYFQGYLTYKGARWTGLNKKKSLLTGIICSTLFQGTVEMFDAYSAKWGFSVTDMAANLTGTSVFALQEHFWNDQRIKIKISSIPKKYPNTKISSSDGMSTSNLTIRANELFGDGLLERFLKDYNAQTYWASINVHSMLPAENRWPGWLNIAVGYGVENLFGGFDNSWKIDGKFYSLNPNEFPRMNQFFISPDIDFTKIKTKSPFLKSLFTGLNIFKMPSPAIEFNTQGQVVFHLFK